MAANAPKNYSKMKKADLLAECAGKNIEQSKVDAAKNNGDLIALLEEAEAATK